MKLVTDIQITGFQPSEEPLRIIVEFSDGTAKDIILTRDFTAERVGAALSLLGKAISNDS